MSAETVEVLRRARALIADPEHWCTGDWARDAALIGAHPKDANACRWCASGALMAASDQPDGAGWVLTAAAHSLYAAEVIAVNDDLGHAAVLAMYDRAIALAESEPES